MGIQKVRTAVVGCGMISDIYLENLTQKFSIFDTVGCCDLIPELAQKKAEKYGIRVLSMEEILADESIELVINLTFPKAHYPVIKQLLEGGKHVYTEKIMAVELKDAQELVRLADENGLYLGAAPDTFLGASIQTARQLVDAGLIGEVTSCRAALNRDYKMLTELIPFIAGPGGGIAFDVGIYYMTALLSILGPVKEVSGFMKTREPQRTHYYPRNANFGESYTAMSENVMVGSLVFQNGVFGTFHFNSESIMNERPELILYGTQGILYMGDPNLFGGVVHLVRKGQTEPVAIPPNFGYGENSRGLGAAEMAWSLRKGRTPRASKEMALNALEAIHGIAISSGTGSKHTLQSTFVKAPPLPQGYLGTDYFGSDSEAVLAI
jgi:predicted dehydrogenase